MITTLAEPQNAAAAPDLTISPTLPQSGEPLGRGTTAMPRDRSSTGAHVETVNAELSALVRAVTHALRSPLWAVDGFTRMALEEVDETLNEECLHDMQSILKGVEKITDLVNELARLSRVSRHELQPEPVNLSVIATSILRQLQQNDRHRSVEMCVDENVVAYGDPQLLGLVMANMLGNAWKFTRDSHPARIEFRLRANVYSIRDNGVGFASEEKENIFLPFHRFHSPNEYQGKGMGLAIVRRVIHLHGGQVWSEGRVGHGATFSFTLNEVPTTCA